ncbi:O-methyltransferase [Talaromyces pinophilus]|uniref:O-methyltransferase n=1 Tax=Talaromyces pinophilus TaxID=128442 RepID=A0A698XKV7_TALPI|nr:O-methyltransferase, family 2 [Penicillium occitanis (nom. inval.)]PCH10292.1 hypothetical protein PENOC_002640 [Penicillium occitanis (nom. inval.)]GAM33811.1 O-methyltransferase [Talaromyces pinophilus]
MPTDVNAIIALSKEVAELSKKYESGAEVSKNEQNALVHAAEKLAIAVRDPDENMYNIAGQVSHNAAVRSAIAMNLFDFIPHDGSEITLDELSKKLGGANKELLGRILRACASTHLFEQTGVESYKQNMLSRAYLTDDNIPLAAQMYDFISHAILAIPEFGSQTDWKHIGDYTRGPFQVGFRTELGYMEYLQANPQRIKSWNAGMRLGRIGHRTSAFPFQKALELDPPAAEGGIAVVDVGGGRGQALEGIRQDYPDIKGRMILLDLPGVITDAKNNGLPQYIETAPGSFFDPLPQGARLYHFRRVLHIWGQQKGKELLENTKKYMDDYSRIVIADMVLADVGCLRDLAMQDLNMMSLGGMERSESEWKELIASAGLVLNKIWYNHDGPKHAVVEAVLPTYKGHKLD